LQVSKNDQYSLRDKLGIIEGDFVYLFVGRLVSDKGINELVKAFQDLRHKNFKLILLGAYEEDLDPLSPETLKIIETNNQIITPGFVKDVRLYFSISDVFVFPSYREGFPNVVLQAAAMALPSIVTNINGSNEIIINDFNGLIIPTQDIKTLRDSMWNLFENTKYRKFLASNSRKLVCLKYSQRFVWDSTKSEYESLIGKK
jgi:glycosyltransferase involved in cell wall biosynthesis